MTDLLAMLEADVGIIVGSSGTLIKVAQAYNIQLRPLVSIHACVCVRACVPVCICMCVCVGCVHSHTSNSPGGVLASTC